MITPITQYTNDSIRGLCYNQLYLTVNECVSYQVIDKLIAWHSMYVVDEFNILTQLKTVVLNHTETHIEELYKTKYRIGLDSDLFKNLDIDNKNALNDEYVNDNSN